MNHTLGEPVQFCDKDLEMPRWAVAANFIIPSLGAAIAGWHVIVGTVAIWEVSVLVILYALTMLGITCGFHRLYSHRSFKTGKKIRLCLGILGSMAWQGRLINWVAVHRLHHRHSDMQSDPHSPVTGPNESSGIKRFIHAHLGWMLQKQPVKLSLVQDLVRDETAAFVNRGFLVWGIIGLLIPAAIGYFVSGVRGFCSGFVWGGLLRVFLVQHMTWCINSVCHLWGKRPYPDHDCSRNNLWCAIFTLGEGWHNNHHAFPGSARQGLKASQIDLTYYFILLLEKVGLAWDVKRPEVTVKAQR